MEHTLTQSEETTWTIKPGRKDELTESKIKIIESGFPDGWIEIYENAYGELHIARLDSQTVLKRYGFIPLEEGFFNSKV